MPELIPFQVEHALAITPREHLGAEPLAILEQKAKGPAYTILEDRTILGCGGLVVIWPGVAVCWLLLTDGIARHGLWLTRAVRRFLAEQRIRLNLHRLEITVVTKNERNARWAQLFGFTPENGCARQYTPLRQDVTRYECVRD